MASCSQTLQEMERVQKVHHLPKLFSSPDIEFEKFTPYCTKAAIRYWSCHGQCCCPDHSRMDIGEACWSSFIWHYCFQHWDPFICCQLIEVELGRSLLHLASTHHVMELILASLQSCDGCTYGRDNPVIQMFSWTVVLYPKRRLPCIPGSSDGVLRPWSWSQDQNYAALALVSNVLVLVCLNSVVLVSVICLWSWPWWDQARSIC